MEHPLSQFKYCPKCGSEHFNIHNEKSKQCTNCGFVYYFNPSSATVALILNKKNELLVCRRAKDPAKGTLDLPGGFIDMNETAEEGVEGYAYCDSHKARCLNDCGGGGKATPFLSDLN